MTTPPSPQTIELFSKGLGLHQVGQLEGAEKYYRDALIQCPSFFDALHLLGVLLAQKGQLEAALILMDQALAASPRHEGVLTNRGLALHQLGRYESALSDFECALDISSDNALNYYNRGNTLQELKQYQAALQSYDKAIALDPQNAEIFNNRGNTLQELKQYQAALQSYDKAIALDPRNANAHYNRGNTLQELKQYQAALQSYDKAIALDPQNAEAFNGRGVIYEKLKQYESALKECLSSININNSYATAHFNLANILRKAKHINASLAYYQKAHELNPQHVETIINRANTLRILKQYGNALQGYQKALALDPHAEFVPGMALHLKMMMCDWNNYDADLHNLSTLISNGQAASEPFPVLSLLDSLQLQLQITRIYQAIKFKGIERLSLPAPANRQNKIRIGYFSADFRDHPVSYLLVELFERHDRSRFETFAFSLGENTNDSMRNRLSKAFDHFIDVENASDSEIANLSRSHEIDIVVDLGGYTAGARPEIFALRAAPIQVSYIGYLGTMGTGFIDYIVADKTLIPEESRQFYTEKIAYLPSYQANPSDRKIAKKVFTRAELGISENAFVFCCFNNNYKITPPTFASWMNILRAVEGSVLYLYSENDWVQAHLENTVSAHGITKDRLIFGKRLPMPEYLARYQAADLFLDTFPYNAGTTTSDSLWAGTPVLTLMGETFASRMAASLLTAIDMPELITRSSQEYEALAIKIAQDKKLASGLKSKLQTNKLNTKLFNTSAFVQSLEALYTQMYQRHQAGLLPEDLG